MPVSLHKALVIDRHQLAYSRMHSTAGFESLRDESGNSEGCCKLLQVVFDPDFSMPRLTHGIEQSVFRVPSVCENLRHLRTNKPSADDADFRRLKRFGRLRKQSKDQLELISSSRRLSWRKIFIRGIDSTPSYNPMHPLSSGRPPP